MFNDFLAQNINGQTNPQAGLYAKYIPNLVQVGFSQVEPNHLSAQRTSQVYAQLPAAADIAVLQQGQFVKYDYPNGVVNFTGNGEWMLVYNEIKLYRDFQNDCEFALIKDNYNARVYSPFGGAKGNTTVGIYGVRNGADYQDTDIGMFKQSRYYNGNGPVDAQGNGIEVNGIKVEGGQIKFKDKDGNEVAKAIDDVTAAPDMYEMHYNEDPFHIYGLGQELRMPEGTKMVPRVFKTNIGDLFTTNAIDDTLKDLSVGAQLKVITTGDKKGFLSTKGTDTSGMIWQVAKIYTMPDHQPGVKIMRIA